MKRTKPEISRRSALAGAVGIMAAPMVLGAKRAVAKSETIVLSNFGGSYQDAMVKTVLNPFTKETGVNVVNVPAPSLDKIKAMQLTGNVEIDLHTNGGSTLASGARQGLWEKLDLSQLDVQDLVIQPTGDYVAFEMFPEGLTWDPKKFGPGKHPSDFSEFFDLKKFPGRRGVYKIPIYTLEIALLGDGVAPKDVYPLDLDRAFKALDRIKSNIVWQPNPTQQVSLVQTGEVDFSFAPVNRVKATNDSGGGVPLAFSSEQTVSGTDALAILKSAPNKENAMRLVAYFLRPEVQARFHDLTGMISVSKKAVPLASPEARKWQADINAKSLVINDGYWADHLDEVNRRFLEWLQR